MEDARLETHPDLMDPEWRKRAEREARLGAKKDLKRRRKQRPRRRFRMTRKVVVVLFVIGTVALLGAAAVVVHQLRGSSVPAPQPPKAAPVLTGVDLDRPFDRTPAANWREGLAGITVPPGQAVGGFTAQEVDAAYRKVTEAITAARLGSRALRDHDGSELLALLAPNERAQIHEMLTSGPTVEKNRYLTLIGQKALSKAPPRMTGALTVKSGGKGELVIHASYTTAYAFDARPGEALSPSDIVPFLREEQDYVIRKAPPFAKADAGLSFGEGRGYRSHMACDAARAGILAPQYAGKDSTVAGTPPVDETSTYDPTKPLPSRDTCR
ncbi:hypothetical protein DMC61_34665 [Amycolatopsis sp. WAC 04169]|uniref:hypothetical protein n=1 Tax=Amycolatopsis sp. WAC 04169 TaxID=2203197 RepID=UPI000F79F64F|nr:hypothetical protein [Amycolatopsis sp. WAC 04169]RSN22594.1 hypothetical protein DMC61_34665 [Amycolatopsis sp. WAC 04169]